MENVETRFSFITVTHDPRYGQKSAASSKNGNFFVTDFSVIVFFFYFAVKPSKNDNKMSKTEFFYHTHDPRYGHKSVASSKKWHYANMPVHILQYCTVVKMVICRWKLVIFFLIFAWNIDRGYKLEPPQWGTSNEYQQLMF